jgi:hypothetical protein
MPTIGDIHGQGSELDEHELAELALAADPDQPLAADAQPWPGAGVDADGTALLPDWYMPPAVAPVRGARRLVGLAVVGAILGINAFGFCITYGVLEVA